MQFWTGVSGGFASAALLLQFWFASQAESMQLMYRDFGGTLPTTTRLVLHPAWAWGMPVVLVGLLGGILALRTRRPARAQTLAIITAIVAVIIFATSYWASQHHLSLAGTIRD